MEERCPAAACAIRGAVRAIRGAVCGTACAPVQHQDFRRAMGHMAAHFQLMFTVKGRAKRFALRANQEPGWFLMPQPLLEGSEVSLMPLGPCPDVPHPSSLCFPPRKTPHCSLPELSGKAERDGAKDMGRRGRSLLPSLLPWASQELARIFRRSGES